MIYSIIPEDYPLLYNSETSYQMLHILEEREKWTKKGMFAYVCKKWTKPLAKWIGSKKCLEIMSGAGWLTAALREEEVNILATDDLSWQTNNEWENVIHPIEMDADTALETFKDQVDILIVSWPPMSCALHEAISEHWMNKPIIFIGELGGCTGCDEFAKNFTKIIDADFELVSKEYKPWFAMHDELLLGQYK